MFSYDFSCFKNICEDYYLLFLFDFSWFEHISWDYYSLTLKILEVIKFKILIEVLSEESPLKLQKAIFHWLLKYVHLYQY